jgi:hypothetical protein
LIFGAQSGPMRYSREELVNNGISWVKRNLHFFDPIKDEERVNTNTLKPFAELAHFCMIVGRHRPEYLTAELANVIEFVDHAARRSIFRDRIVRQPSLFLLYAGIYIALGHCGRGEQSWREVIQRLIDAGYVSAIERVPFRNLDLRHLLDSARYSHNMPSRLSLYRQTLCRQLPSVLYLTDNDVYSITHTLFYLSNFGEVKIDNILGLKKRQTCEILELLLGIFTRQGNWDIVGELLICCACLNWHPKPMSELAWQGLLSGQFKPGEIAGPRFDPKKVKKKNINYRFEQNYHTTLIGIIACVMENDLRKLR